MRVMKKEGAKMKGKDSLTVSTNAEGQNPGFFSFFFVTWEILHELLCFGKRVFAQPNCNHNPILDGEIWVFFSAYAEIA